MKILFKYSLIIASAFFLFSCEKETEDVSRITEYATFEMQGEDFMYVLRNTTFTDPGVTAHEGESDLPVEIKGTVDTSTDGVYTIQYSAINSDGFPASVERTVAVVSAIPTADLSGTYQIVHATRKNKITITKNKEGVGYYHATDSWWQTYPIPLDFVDMGDGTIKILSGSSPYGAHYGKGELLPSNQIKFTVTLANQGPLNYTTTYQLLQ